MHRPWRALRSCIASGRVLEAQNCPRSRMRWTGFRRLSGPACRWAGQGHRCRTSIASQRASRRPGVEGPRRQPKHDRAKTRPETREQREAHNTRPQDDHERQTRGTRGKRPNSLHVTDWMGSHASGLPFALPTALQRRRCRAGNGIPSKRKGPRNLTQTAALATKTRQQRGYAWHSTSASPVGRVFRASDFTIV